MNRPTVWIAQCWDDGVASDARLADLLRRHGAQATFNLNAGLTQPRRHHSWTYKGQEVWRLGWDEMRSVYEGFTIANHGLTHAALPELDDAALLREVADNRHRLQDFFGQPVDGFVYAYGRHDARSEAAVAAAGHCYARTTGQPQPGWPQATPMALAPHVRFNAPDFWALFERACASGRFYFWGHSYEFESEAQWQAFDALLTRMGQAATLRWCTPAELLSLPDSAPSVP